MRNINQILHGVILRIITRPALVIKLNKKTFLWHERWRAFCLRSNLVCGRL